MARPKARPHGRADAAPRVRAGQPHRPGRGSRRRGRARRIWRRSPARATRSRPGPISIRTFALAQARQLDAHRQRGAALGPLHGVPVGVKDIVDTRDLPTENGTPLDAGRRATQDAALVDRLGEAGAVILGKTVTTELAGYHPARRATRTTRRGRPAALRRARRRRWRPAWCRWPSARRPTAR